jgi:hypothetical protein
MFGSNFDANFGIPAFPLQGVDPQGGLFGVNTPPLSDPAAAQSGSPLALPGGPASPTSASGAPATAGPSQPSLGAPSPLGGGVLSPGGGAAPSPAPETAAPAAGVGSPFGRASV